MTDQVLKLFHDGIEHCPACGAKLEWKPSPDGRSVDVLHPYDPAIGPPCLPFKKFCDALLERRSELISWEPMGTVRAAPKPTDWREPCEPGEHVVNPDRPDWCMNCGAQIGPEWGYPPVTPADGRGRCDSCGAEGNLLCSRVYCTSSTCQCPTCVFRRRSASG